MFGTRGNGENGVGDASNRPVLSALAADSSATIASRRSASRVRSQSDHGLLASHMTANTTIHNANGGGLLLDSDDDGDVEIGSAPSAPIGISSNGNGNGTGGAIPIPFMASASLVPPRSRFNRRENFLQGNLSPTSSEDEENAEMQQLYSTSYAGPRDLTHYTFEMAQMTGYLEKQSVKSPDVWKRRWFVMQESVLFYYRTERDAIDTKPSDRTCCGVIQLDNVDSVTTAKDFGVGAFQIRLPERKYILRAVSKENMHDWLFNFQKSIANIVSLLLRTKTDHRFNRGHSSVTRRSFSRVSRSVSFEYPDNIEFGRMSADFPSHHLQLDLMDPNSVFPDEYPSEGQRTSPRRASSPLNFSHYGPRSPVSIFAFDPPFESISDEGLGMGDNGPLIEGLEGEEDDDSEEPTKRNPLFETAPGFGDLAPAFGAPAAESPALQRTLSPPVTAGKYVPRFMRDRQNATPAPPPIEIASPPRQSPPPLQSSLSWLLRTSRDSYAVCTGEGETVIFDDNVSFTGGGEFHGVTSLKGVRKNLEDVCCCVPDLNLHLPTTEYAKHSLYALFDGHCGIRAAKYLDEKLLSYLCEHESFTTNDARPAFIDAFKRIDDEFLTRATSELVSDGSTAAVVLIRGNKLLTANVGDSRAVVSINGVALDVIEEQTPGRPDERERIEQLGGWVKEERELQMSKLHSMDLSDPWIKQKAERVVRWVNVYRVNGELAVSRAIGDMEYKGKALTDYQFWAFPEGHDHQFHGDLVICDPEFKEIEITPEVKFLILACDGLWDTITSQEAVNHVKEKLSEGYSNSQISHSLADLAIRSGSSDNVSVIIVILHQ